MPEPPQQPGPPTAEDQANAQQVAVAGMTAAQAEPEPAERPKAAKRAMRSAAKDRGWDIPEEVLEKMSSMFGQSAADQTIEQLEARGAFDAPPEAVSPPPQPVAPPSPSEGSAAPEQAPGPAAPAPPGKRSWAQRFMGQ